MKILLALLLTFFAVARADADIIVTNVAESGLPYSLSPQNYDLSPSNYENSESNYENSPSNYNNSSSSYDNSPSNYENTINGKRSILVEENRKLLHIGYYVLNKDGVTNFYSTKGTRLFYSPKSSVGLYHGEKGFFCGVLAKIDGRPRLALTEKGQKVLLLSE
jgi:hypothetical protein